MVLKENETADLRLSLKPGAVLLNKVSVRSEGGVNMTLRPVRNPPGAASTTAPRADFA